MLFTNPNSQVTTQQNMLKIIAEGGHKKNGDWKNFQKLICRRGRQLGT